MLERRDTGMKGRRKGGMKEIRDERKEGFRTGGIHKSMDSGLEGYGKEGLQKKEEMRVQEVCGTGEMLDRRDAGKVECR